MTANTAPRNPAAARRNGDLAMIHMAAKRLFGDTSKGGDGRVAYEDWLERHTGKRSSASLSAGQRIDMCKMLRREGLIPDRARGGIGQTKAGEERPTPAQWGKIGGLARSIGWTNGLNDPGLQAFILRTAKVAAPRFLSRTQASKVILGLEQWLRQKQKSGGNDAMP